MTIPALESCRDMIFLATGESKVDAARRAFAEPPSPDTPASLVCSKLGETVAVLDRDAAGRTRPISARDSEPRQTPPCFP